MSGGSTTYNVQPLDSFRVGRYHLPIPCYVCRTDNLFDGVVCRTCHAPLELTRSHAETKAKCQLVATLGGTDVGKTVFLGAMLDLLSKSQVRGEHILNDASSIALQKNVLTALAQHAFPDRTPSDAREWAWGRCHVNSPQRKQPCPIFLVDVAGSSVLDETDHPGTCPALDGLFRRATGIFLVVDAGRMSRGDKDEEFFARQIVTHLAAMRQEMPQEPRAKRRNGDEHGPELPPVAVVLAKADQCELAFEDPHQFLRAQMPGLDQFFQEYPMKMEVFPVSAVGATATCVDRARQTREFPLRVELRGMTAPFEWLSRQW